MSPSRDPNQDDDDAAEVWGRRIGRALSAVAAVALLITLALTYL